jgi:methionyl-tRNA synthetase
LLALTYFFLQYGVDQTRFFLMSEVAFGSDGDFSDKEMVLKINNVLANELGNLCQRTLSMAFKNCDRQVPTPGDFIAPDVALLQQATMLRQHASAAIANQAILKYVQALVSLIRDSNKYIDEMAPWVLKKTDTKRMETVLYVILEVLRHAAILYQPLIPTSANKILDQLTVPQHERTFAHLATPSTNGGDTSYSCPFQIKPGASIAQPQIVFPRLEVPEEVTV